MVRLLESGVALGWMLRVDDAERARWLCSRQVALPLLLAFFAVSPVYSALNQVRWRELRTRIIAAAALTPRFLVS